MRFEAARFAVEQAVLPAVGRSHAPPESTYVDAWPVMASLPSLKPASRRVSWHRVGMRDTGLLDELLDPFARCLDTESARRVADFRIAPVIQEPVDALAENANDGALTQGERRD